MVGRVGSPTRTVYVDMTLTRSKVKLKVTGLLNFRQLAKPCMLAAMTAAPLLGFLVEFPSRKDITRVQNSPNVHISRNSNGHISVLRDATVTFGHAGSPTRTVYVDMTLTRSMMKVKVTEYLNFRQLPITAHFQVYLLRHFRVQLKTDG